MRLAPGSSATPETERIRPQVPAGLITKAVPTSASASQLLPVLAPLSPLFPGKGLQRGTVLLVETGKTSHGGSTTLSIALISAATASSSWCVAVGMGDIGAVAMSELGVDLEHVAMVPRPGHKWAKVVASALDGVDVVLLRLPFPARGSMARNLVARARERRAVLIVLAAEKAWPEGPDLLLKVESAEWSGLGEGYGHLRSRKATVIATGRRSATKPVRRELWLPGPDGSVGAVEEKVEEKKERAVSQRPASRHPAFRQPEMAAR